MFGNHRSLLARHSGPLLVFVRYGSCLSWSISFFSKTTPGCSDLGIDFFFCSVFEVSGLSEVIGLCHFFIFSDQLVYLPYLHGLSCILSFLCVFYASYQTF